MGSGPPPPGSSYWGSSRGFTPRASPINSPQNLSQKRLSAHIYAGEPGDQNMSQASTTEFVEQLNKFPTTGQTLSYTVMRDMLITLRRSLHRDMMNSITELRNNVSSIGDRVSHIKDKMGEFTVAHNELVDTHNDTEGDMQSMKDKIADLEDRSRRNNIKLRGVEEAVTPAELRHYVQQFIATILPDTPDREEIVDRSYRLPKPKFYQKKSPEMLLPTSIFFTSKMRSCDFLGRTKHY